MALHQLTRLRTLIGKQTRELRKQRQLTQSELAGELGISQGRLSELERGDGSFTAEQLLTLLRIFNVPISAFAGRTQDESAGSLQRALVRLGATHLQESDDVLPTERLAELDVTVRETIVDADSPRQLAALAPVIVRNVDRINLQKTYYQLANAGLQQRLGWIVENTLAAVDADLLVVDDSTWRRLEQRARTVLGFVVDEWLKPSPNIAPDILDKTIRSPRSLKTVESTRSAISRRWNMMTAIQPSDFTRALGEARGAV
ncbi:MAG TPA: helix-turn-helix transcriptional regulator [Polyangiaceae bacterium]